MCVSLLVLRIVDGEVPARAFDRRELRRWMRRSLLAERRIVGRPHGGRDPHAAAMVEHRIVHVVAAGPDRFAHPSTATVRHVRRGPRRVARRAPSTSLASPCDVPDRGQAGSRRSTRARHRSGRWHSPSGCAGRSTPTSCRYAFGSAQSHCVITTLRSTPCGRGGRRRQLARGNAIGPVREHRERAPRPGWFSPLSICAPA